MDYRTVLTSAEVVAVLRAAHGDSLAIFSSCTKMGDGLIRTEWGFRDSPIPLCGAETVWEHGEKPSDRVNEKTIWWLCFPSYATP